METPEHIRIYCDGLTRLGYGSPIYEPDPGCFEHVQIGDVGYIERYTGHFHRVFNAFHNAESPINRFGTPAGFEPLSEDFKHWDKGADLPSGVHCMHIKVDKQFGFDIEGSVIPAGAELELSSSRDQGAMIVIKEPAERVNSACRAMLANVLEQNHGSWLEFVRRRSPNLDLQKMLFVTGYDLASDWATATVKKSNTDVKIRFKISDALMQTVSASTSMWGSWEYSSNVPVRFGPSASQKERHLDSNLRKSQCIFIRAFRMVRRGLKLKAGAGPHTLTSGKDDLEDPDSPILMNVEDDSEEEHNEFADVYDKAFEYLLERTTDEFVLLHDDDVPRILEEIASGDTLETTLPLLSTPDKIAISQNELQSSKYSLDTSEDLDARYIHSAETEYSAAESNTDYLHAEFGRYLKESYPLAHSRMPSDDGDDDGSSMISISTTATIDDTAGSGRIIDKFIYQPIGRGIERLAMRFTISSLHPDRIAEYIGTDVSGLAFPFDASMTLHDAIANLCFWERNGSTIVAGMKGLVKQTKSNSINRSASALAALIRVSLGLRRREIYANVSGFEPIFHIETLVRSHPDEKWFLFLVKLGRETLIAIRSPSLQYIFDPFLRKDFWQLQPSPEAALNLRQRLMQVLNVYRLSGLDSLDDTIGQACAICAEAASTCIDPLARGDAYMHILDTVYFTVILILRSTYELADQARVTNSKLINTVTRTLAYWMDAIVHQCINSAENFSPRYDMDLLKVAIAFRSVVVLVSYRDVDTKDMLLPESFKKVRPELLSNDVIPRRYREKDKDIHHIENLIEAAQQRTRRVLTSFDALELEVWGCTSQSNYSTTQVKFNAEPHWTSLDDFGDEWWNHWEITFKRAQRVQVQENGLTEEFRKARRIGLELEVRFERAQRERVQENGLTEDIRKARSFGLMRKIALRAQRKRVQEDGLSFELKKARIIGLERDPLGDPNDKFLGVQYNVGNWGYYQLCRASRHKWGQYLRSNMDWDWDLGSCLRRLFKVEATREDNPQPRTTTLSRDKREHANDTRQAARVSSSPTTKTRMASSLKTAPTHDEDRKYFETHPPSPLSGMKKSQTVLSVAGSTRGQWA